MVPSTKMNIRKPMHLKKHSLGKSAVYFVIILFGLTGISAESSAQFSDNFQVSGYLQGNPVRIAAELPEPIGDQSWMEYRLQNRLNVRWFASSDLTIHWQMRTRFFAGDLVRDFPQYADGIDTDDGLVNLSWMITQQDNWLLHYIPDRFYAEWDRGDWNIRVGRQRINWGVNMITNPNDIFNIYSLYDFDYPERPGSDAIRVQRFIGFFSRLEIAISPARELRNSVAAALYSFDFHGYDIQLISGYYRERLATGAGWAGDHRGIGLKGETMFFADFEKENGSRETNFIISASAEYMFGNSLFLITELLYNHEGGREEFMLLGEQITPDNPSFSKYQATTQISYPIHPLVDGSLAAIYYPDEEAVFFSPTLTWSVIENMDFQILGQFFIGSSDSVFGMAGNVLTASLKYSF